MTFSFSLQRKLPKKKDDGMNYALMFLRVVVSFFVVVRFRVQRRNELQLSEDIHGEIRPEERICGQSYTGPGNIRKSKRRSS